MSNQKRVELILSTRIAEMLNRLASIHRRSPAEEVAFIIEAVARGQYQDHGDFRITAPISLSDLPPILVERVSASVVRELDHPSKFEPPPRSENI